MKKSNYFRSKEDIPKYDVMGVSLEVKSEDIEEDGKFKGWGSTFGGSPDDGGDVIVKGAFEQTIANGGRNGNGIAMLYQHQASEPIGVWTTLQEMDKGLWVEGELNLDVQRARETHSNMRKGVIKGLSIGYDIARLPNRRRDPEAYEVVETDDTYIRYLKKLDLWEISPVTFPMNIRSTITSVKSFESCITERDWENALRESGLSKSAAQLVVKQMKPSLRESGAQDQVHGELDIILAELRQRNASACDF